jgi:hypothetical protein
MYIQTHECMYTGGEDVTKGESNLSADQVLDLFLSLFGQQTKPLAIRNTENNTVQKTNIFDNIHPNYHESIPCNVQPDIGRIDRYIYFCLFI